MRRTLLSAGSPLEVLEHIFSLPEGTKLKVICLLWMWWSERNKANHAERLLNLDELQHLLGRHVGEWLEFYKPKKSQLSPPVPKWIPPPDDFVKINLDGAFTAESKSGG